MRKIIITGALGHIGSRLIRELSCLGEDYKIVMIDNLSTQRYCSLFDLPENTKYQFIEKNIKDINWSEVLSENVDVLVHLAALTDAAGTADKPDLIYKNNYESTKSISDACLQHKIPLIFPSSTSVYGSQDERVDENCTELNPQSPYAACKIHEEDYIQELFEAGLQGVICRLGTIYGTSPGMRFHTAVNKFCWQGVMHQPVTVWKTALDQKRPYLCLNDCSQALIHIINKKLYSREIYNIVSNNFTVRDVLNTIKKYITRLNIDLVQHKIMNQLSYEVSSQKFLDIGFKFRGKLDTAISDTINLLQKSNES